MSNWNLTYLPHILFETAVWACLLAAFLVLFKRWLDKRNQVAKLLAIFMGLYILSLAFLILGQVIRLMYPEPVFPVGTYWEHFSKTFPNVFIFAANWVFLQFYKEIYTSIEMKKGRNVGFLVFTIAGMVHTFVWYPGALVVSGLILMVHSFLLYVPTTARAYKTFQRVEGSTRWPFFFLFLQALIFIIVWVFQVANLLWDQLTGRIFGPVFWFMWIAILLVGVNAYVGYVFPKWLKRLLKARADKKARAPDRPSLVPDEK